jgi:hypothetical protein
MKIELYFTYDSEDIELITLLINALNEMGIFNVFISPSSPLGTIPSLDNAMKEHIEDCHLFVALFTRTGTRSVLIKREINLAREKNKIVIPLFESTARLHKISDIIMRLSFIRRLGLML